MLTSTEKRAFEGTTVSTSETSSAFWVFYSRAACTPLSCCSYALASFYAFFAVVFPEVVYSLFLAIRPSRTSSSVLGRCFTTWIRFASSDGSLIIISALGSFAARRSAILARLFEPAELYRELILIVACFYTRVSRSALLLSKALLLVPSVIETI